MTLKEKKKQDMTSPAVQKPVCRPERKQRGSSNRLEFFYFNDGVDMYHIPKGKKWVRSTFDSFYLSAGGMYIHTGGKTSTLYEMEPLYEGHQPSELSLRCTIPYNSYHLSQSYLKNMECLFVLYKKGFTEPLWIGRPELSGILFAELPLIKFEHGEYFLLIANLTPSAQCQHQFKRMDFCWRYDFEFMPNGIQMEHPSPIGGEISSDTVLNLRFKKFVPTALDRFTAQFFDQEYHFMGAAQDIRPQINLLKLPLPRKYAWTDGTYHVVLQHNLFNYGYIRLSCQSGKIQMEDIKPLPEENPFYRLSIDVSCNDDILRYWSELYGCRQVKEKLLQFIATHELNDYQHFSIEAPQGFVPNPKVLANLLYDSSCYMELNVRNFIDCFGMVNLKTLFNHYERDTGPIVLGLFNVSDIFTPKGQELLSDLESFISVPYHSLLVCGTHAEIKQLYEQLPSLEAAIVSDNRWSVCLPTVEEYIRMVEVLCTLNKLQLSISFQDRLCALFNSLSDRLIGITPTEMDRIITQRVIKPFKQRSADGDNIHRDILEAIDLEPLADFFQ